MDKLKELLNKLHEQGLKLPYLRDPIRKVPSVSLTMLFISFNFYLLTLINKLGGWFSDVDGAGQLLIISASLYFGRSISGGKGNMNIDKDETK